MIRRRQVRYYWIIGFPVFELGLEGVDTVEFLYFSMGTNRNMWGLDEAGIFYKDCERVF